MCGSWPWAYSLAGLDILKLHPEFLSRKLFDVTITAPSCTLGILRPKLPAASNSTQLHTTSGTLAHSHRCLRLHRSLLSHCSAHSHRSPHTSLAVEAPEVSLRASFAIDACDACARLTQALRAMHSVPYVCTPARLALPAFPCTSSSNTFLAFKDGKLFA